MNAFLYGVTLQWKLDIRSKTLLVTCYIVPLLFFALMGGIFSSINPSSKATLIQSMTVMGVSMAAMVGMPTSLVAIYGSDVKKMYQVNGVPLYLGLVSIFISTFLHLMIMSAMICLTAPIAFKAELPENPPLYLCSLVIFIAVSLSIGSILGLLVRDQAKLTMISQLAFLPSIMLSGIMFPVNMLPKPLEYAGKLFPAAWGYRLMTGDSLEPALLIPLAAIFLTAFTICCYLLSKHKNPAPIGK